MTGVIITLCMDCRNEIRREDSDEFNGTKYNHALCSACEKIRKDEMDEQEKKDEENPRKKDGDDW
jgi:hypothetical protein